MPSGRSKPETGATPGPRGAPSIGAALTLGLCTGALSFALAGLLDGVASWQESGQFVPTFGAKIRWLLFLTSSYGLAGGLLGTVAAALLLGFSRFTRLGDLVRLAASKHRRLRERDPRSALTALSFAIVVPPLLGAAGWVAHAACVEALADRRHFGLVVGVVMVATAGAVLAVAVVSFALARPVELGLQHLARRDAVARRLSSPWAIPVVLAIMLVAVGVASFSMAWSTLSLLPLRPLWVALAALVLSEPSSRMSRRLLARLHGKRRAIRATAPVAVLVAIALIMSVAGASDGARQAANMYSGLGAPLMRAYREAIDLDGDGYSPILGGGDCNDWNEHVHPGASEIPDDGIDQNCVGGDAKLHREPAEFAEVPATVPDDANVLLLTIDTIRWDHLGAYGYERDTSPVMDALAEDGTLFVNAWAHAPSTRYSMPAILTGRYPLHVYYDHTIRGWPGLLPKATTIAEALAPHGFVTGAITNHWYFDPVRRMNQGFDHYDNENAELHVQDPRAGPAKSRGSSSRQQTDKALAWLDDNGAQRFFLWVHYYDPHYIYESHPEVPSFGEGEIARYDEEIRFTDLHLGRLFQWLRDNGQWDRTIVVITGDHGEGFGEHGIDKHGYHLYAAQTRVPFIARIPGLEPRRVETPATHIDILPTLANLAGGEPKDYMEGRSLVDLMAKGDDTGGDRFVFQQLSYENNNEMRAAADDRCHVIYNVSPTNSWELYDIEKDPLEEHNIIDDPGPCDHARPALERWLDWSELPQQVGGTLLDERPQTSDPADVRFDDAAELVSVEVSGAPVGRGRTFELTWTWEALESPPSDHRVFVHFERPSGGRFQADHDPRRPIAWWREGQIIRYEQTVTVPPDVPAGEYEIWMGLFKGAERMPPSSDSVSVSADRRARVGTVNVR